eukprot:TRINITY_DN15139_c0_g1_i1.p1 TRINITY_DN15139_c0_g1~~TRINITY_DN15139_c0_g1_i1.p1  ORF type:complete len:548 (+),score=144.52 TRINITY_DN15139_c0_g1_i1:137-1645(+)
MKEEGGGSAKSSGSSHPTNEKPRRTNVPKSDAKGTHQNVKRSGDRSHNRDRNAPKDPTKWFNQGHANPHENNNNNNDASHIHHRNQHPSGGVPNHRSHGHTHNREEDANRSDLRRSLFEWEEFDVGKLNDTFSVVSFNLLSPTIASNSMELYPDFACPPECLDWRNRRDRIVQHIHVLNADIVCVQELDTGDLDWMKKRMEAFGYLGLYKKRFGNKPDGCATFWKKSKFSLVSHKYLDYYNAHGWTWLDRDNIALMVLLNPNGTNEYLCSTNTHILFNKKRGDIKLGQLSVLINEMNNFKIENPEFSMSWIMCGDFNCTPESQLINFVSESVINLKKANCSTLSGQKRGEYSPLHHSIISSLLSLFPSESEEVMEDTNGKEEVNEEKSEEKEAIRGKKKHKKETNPELRHPLNLRSAYPLDPEAITTYHKDGQMMVDYIWYSEGLERNGLRKVPTKSHLRAGLIGKGWPNLHQCSDHIPLMASFGWKFGESAQEQEEPMEES